MLPGRSPLAGLIFAVLLLAGAFCQSSSSKPAFDIADVHVSPREVWVKTLANAMRPGILNAGRYEIRRATMLDLIRTAYSVDADKVYGGPAWLDYDRFEVIAKAPPATSPADLALMLQSLLADRFHLVVRADSKPVPAWLLSVAKGGPKLKRAEGSGTVGCQTLPPTINNDVSYLGIRCRNVNLATFAATLRSYTGRYFRNLSVVDATGLKGFWDIDVQYPAPVVDPNPASATPPAGDIRESISKQLGLTLELKTAPQPVLSVERVREQPTANPPGVAAALPPLPSPEFEVASFKPCDGTGPTLTQRFNPGGRVTARCMPLMSLIRDAWGLGLYQGVPGAPKWLAGGNAHGFTFEAKAPAGTYTDATGAQDRDALNAMIRALLIDRFKIKFHYEERPMDAQTLVAVKPKLTKADPAARTGCTRRQAPGNADRLAIQLVCRNITMAQFVEQIPAYDSRISFPVLDSTGIEGAWDFTLNYSLPRFFLSIVAARGGGEPGRASDPAGGLWFADALAKQLGLKLETHKRPEQVLVIDHIEEKPTEN